MCCYGKISRHMVEWKAKVYNSGESCSFFKKKEKEKGGREGIVLCVCILHDCMYVKQLHAYSMTVCT